MPLSVRSPRCSSAKPALSSRRVAPAITTWPGAANACRRAARFGRLADHRLLLRRALADQLADDYVPGRDPDPGRERRPSGGVQLADRVDEPEPGPDRALGFVLMGPRPAEIGQHAVAHELGDIAFEARDLARDRFW